MGIKTAVRETGVKDSFSINDGKSVGKILRRVQFPANGCACGFSNFRPKPALVANIAGYFLNWQS